MFREQLLRICLNFTFERWKIKIYMKIKIYIWKMEDKDLYENKDLHLKDGR